MNEKINFQDLSALLAEKAAITKKDAETFLREYFEVMAEELVKSGLLKIKDLGTFKLLPVEDRESIDVTTGEKVLIPAHYKVTFSPDKKLAETVNEPFAFFETIELEEGFESEELELLADDDDSKESEQDSELTPEEEEIVIFEKKPVVEEKKESFFEISPIAEGMKESFFEMTTPIAEGKKKSYFEEEEPIVEEEERSYFEEESVEDEIEVSEEESAEEEDESYFEEEPVEDEESYFELEPVMEEERRSYFEEEPVVDEEEDIYLKSRPIVDLGESFWGRELTPEKDQEEENVISIPERDIENESLQEEDVFTEEDEISTDEKSRTFCLNCHDYKAHLAYRKKYFSAKQSQNRLRIIVGFLSILLLCAIGYIAYLTKYEKHFSFKEPSPAVVINGSASKENSISVTLQDTVPAAKQNTVPAAKQDTVPTVKQDTVPVARQDTVAATKQNIVPVAKKDTVVQVPVTSNNNVVAVEKPAKTEAVGKSTTPKTPEKVKQITVVSGQRLTTISLEEYGNKAFWVYIYLENKSRISNPEVLPVGIKLTIPPPEKYSIDSNDPASVQRANELAGRYVKPRRS